MPDLIPFTASSLALPPLPADADILIQIARRRAEENAEDLERDAKLADLRNYTATQVAVSAFNEAYPTLAIGSDPLTPGQRDAFTAFIARQPAPLSLDAIASAGIQFMAEVNAQALAEHAAYMADLAAGYETQVKQLEAGDADGDTD